MDWLIDDDEGLLILPSVPKQEGNP
jgi:hypothetical protein